MHKILSSIILRENDRNEPEWLVAGDSGLWLHGPTLSYSLHCLVLSGNYRLLYILMLNHGMILGPMTF